MRVRTVFTLSLIGLSILGTAHAGTVTWTPTEGYDWSTQQNWTPEMVPGASSTVAINSGTASLGSLTGSTTISALTNTGSASAALYLASGGTLNVTNGITATSNLTLNISGDYVGQATLNLSGTSTLPGDVFVNGSGNLNLQAGAAANIHYLNLSAGSGLEAVATVANGAALNLDTLSAGANGILDVYGAGTATATNAFSLFGGNVGLNNGGTLSLTGTTDLGQAYAGGPEIYGGYISNGAYVAAGNGSGTLNLGSDVSMNGSTSGTLASGYEANSNLTVNNIAGRTIYIVGGNIGTSDGINQIFLTGNMNFVGTTLDGGAGGLVLQGTNNFLLGTTWNNYINLANNSVTTVSEGINQGANALTVNLLGNAQLIVNNAGYPGAAGIDGTYNIAPNASLTMEDAYLAPGAVVNTSGNFYVPNGYSQSTGTTEVNGLLDAGTSDVDITGGELQGSGTIDAGDVSVSGGATIKPGDSPGIMTINGNLTLASDATTLIQYGGTDNSDPSNAQYDAFVVNGTAYLGGYLATQYMDLDNGYTPEQGDIFTIMTCTDGCEGTFSGLYDWVSPDEYFEIVYGTDSVELEVEDGTPQSPAPSATPEPGSWLLLATGLVAVEVRRRIAVR